MWQNILYVVLGLFVLSVVLKMLSRKTLSWIDIQKINFNQFSEQQKIKLKNWGFLHMKGNGSETDHWFRRVNILSKGEDNLIFSQFSPDEELIGFIPTERKLSRFLLYSTNNSSKVRTIIDQMQSDGYKKIGNANLSLYTVDFLNNGHDSLLVEYRQEFTKMYFINGIVTPTT